MVHDGLLYRSHGQGTFVSDPKIARRLAKLTSFSEDMRDRGIRTRSLVITADVIEAPASIAQRLCMDLGSRVVRLEKLRFGGEEPLAIQVSHIPFEPYGDLVLQNRDQDSLYEIFEWKAGCRIWKGEQAIEAVPAKKHEASLLKVRVGFPLLVIERVTYDDRGLALELARTLYRSDRFKYEVTLFR